MRYNENLVRSMDYPDKKEDNTEFGLLHKISKLERIKCVV